MNRLTLVPLFGSLLCLAAAISGCKTAPTESSQHAPSGNPYGNPAGYEGRASGYPSDSDYVDATPDAGHRAPSYGTQPSYQPPATASRSGGSHTVVKGDTLYGIARRHSTTVSALKSANGLTADTIRIGQVLRLP